MLVGRCALLSRSRYMLPNHGVWLQNVKSQTMLRLGMPSCYSKDAKNSDSSDEKTKGIKRFADSFGEAGIKLPSRAQVENVAVKTLVYLWDFTYYVFCLLRKLFHTYIVNNSIVQENWNRLLKRMEDARREIKSK